MYTPPSLTIALLMMITSAICWGSWANTYKGVKNYRFELFYWDYAIGIFLVSLILALTMGSSGHDAFSFVNNVQAADVSNIASTLVGGAISIWRIFCSLPQSTWRDWRSRSPYRLESHWW